MTIEEVQQEIVDEFSGYDDWMDKYSYLIELGNDMPPYPEEQRTQQNLIDGCQSQVWIFADYRDGKIFFEADSDAIIVKGIVGLLVRVLSDHTPQEILDTNLHFIDDIGLKENLTPTRSNGLLAMIKQMKLYALAFKEKQN
ncbi:MAG: SufE family protein [Bacteroidales bacterium]|jgi:cysteine desulfuration protein SufE|nr:SufE family protein [Bacteroidales bacterium]MCR5695484.1 SufE family protein [Marinilabiliaceae bacterium]